jgi:alkylation response protein AidB-like acyl-CoA dehydrogenase
MTITDKQTAAPAATYPTAARPGDDRFVSLAAEVGAVAAAHADAHDRDATFVSEAYDAMRANGYLRLGEPEEGADVIHFAVPLAAEGVRLDETWDTLGMRGTASHDVVLEDVFVPADRVMGRRPWGEFGVPLAAAAIHFAPVGGATYLGIAMGARDAAVARSTATSRGPSPLAQLPRVHRQVGLMDAKLRVAWWALLGAIDELGDDYGAGPQALATVMIAKRQAVIDAIAVVDLAMDVLGGRAYFRSARLERAYRDVRAGTFHPLTPEATLAYAGKLALGDPGVAD